MNIDKYLELSGWSREQRDKRDLMYQPRLNAAMIREDVVSLRKRVRRVYDQGSIGSCVAHSTCAAYEMAMTPDQTFTPSRLAIYFAARYIDSPWDVERDIGTFNRSGVKATVKYGVATENEWPYDVSRFAEMPPKPIRDAALDRQTLEYRRVKIQRDDIFAALSEGLPIIFGAQLYANFQSPEMMHHGIVSMPNGARRGGHSQLIVGADFQRGLYEVLNSWSDKVGDHGYLWYPLAYIEDQDLCDDFWVIRRVEQQGKAA